MPRMLKHSAAMLRATSLLAPAFIIWMTFGSHDALHAEEAERQEDGRVGVAHEDNKSNNDDGIIFTALNGFFRKPADSIIKNGGAYAGLSRQEIFEKECIIHTRLPVCNETEDDGKICVYKTDPEGNVILAEVEFDICGKKWKPTRPTGKYSDYYISERIGITPESKRTIEKASNKKFKDLKQTIEAAKSQKIPLKRGAMASLGQTYTIPNDVLIRYNNGDSTLNGKLPTSGDCSTETTGNGYASCFSTPNGGGVPLCANATGWTAVGTQILDPTGKIYNVRGLNWFGIESPDATPHGLWQRKLVDHIQTIKDLGFNTLRIPFAVKNIETNAVSQKVQGDPSLTGKTTLEILDAVIKEAETQGLMVLLDAHSIEPGAFATEGGPWTAIERWKTNWTALATRYKDAPNIIGADLSNEPKLGCWETTKCEQNDWPSLAQEAGDLILQTAPNWLIFVEGVEKSGGVQGWPGGALTGAYTNPVKLKTPNKLVYSPHDYGPPIHEPPYDWFSDTTFPENMTAVWAERWSKLITDKTAPVIIGEFGGKLVDEGEKKWFPTLLTYMTTNNIGAFFWAYNPNSADTGGIVKEPDWTTPECGKLTLMDKWMGGVTTLCQGTGVTTPVTEPATPPTIPSTPGCTTNPTLSLLRKTPTGSSSGSEPPTDTIDPSILSSGGGSGATGSGTSGATGSGTSGASSGSSGGSQGSLPPSGCE